MPILINETDRVKADTEKYLIRNYKLQQINDPGGKAMLFCLLYQCS